MSIEVNFYVQLILLLFSAVLLFRLISSNSRIEQKLEDLKQPEKKRD